MVPVRPRRNQISVIVDVPEGVRRHVANSVLTWIRAEDTFVRVGQQTPRETRDELLRMIALPDPLGLRAANEIYRWLCSSDQARELQWLPDSQGRATILRVFDRGVEKAGAEDDRDLVDDETAITYPRVLDRLSMAFGQMRQFVRDHQRLGTRVAKAQRLLVQKVGSSVEEWAAEG